MKKSPNAFPSSIRILKAGDFKRVFSKPIRIHRHEVSLIVTPNDLGFARLGLAIKKKDVQKAVARNRIRRFVRESFRKEHSALQGIDIVVLVRKGGDLLSHPAIEETLDGLWTELKKRQKTFYVPALKATNTLSVH